MTQVVGVAATSGTGSCHSFNIFSGPWTNLHGFSDVPDVWWALYYEYRVLLQQAYTVTEPIRTVCNSGGGAISPEASQAMTDFFDPAQNRLYVMIGEAQALK